GGELRGGRRESQPRRTVHVAVPLLRLQAVLPDRVDQRRAARLTVLAPELHGHLVSAGGPHPVHDRLALLADVDGLQRRHPTRLEPEGEDGRVAVGSRDAGGPAPGRLARGQRGWRQRAAAQRQGDEGEQQTDRRPPHFQRSIWLRYGSQRCRIVRSVPFARRRASAAFAASRSCGSFTRKAQAMFSRVSRTRTSWRSPSCWDTIHAAMGMSVTNMSIRPCATSRDASSRLGYGTVVANRRLSRPQSSAVEFVRTPTLAGAWRSASSVAYLLIESRRTTATSPDSR